MQKSSYQFPHGTFRMRLHLITAENLVVQLRRFLTRRRIAAIYLFQHKIAFFCQSAANKTNKTFESSTLQSLFNRTIKKEGQIVH